MSFAADHTIEQLAEKMRDAGVRFRSGPFIVHLRSNVRSFVETWASCYPGLQLLSDDEIAHFRIQIRRKSFFSRPMRPQAQFFLEDRAPFEPYPLDHAFPMFEWGLNWCIGTMAHQFLMLHSATLEKHGRALVMPAQPGSGKSTLCAALLGRGWRLLSDEFGIVDMTTHELVPLPRAAPMKNESIEVIRQYCPNLRLGPIFHKTRKGTVSHVFPPDDALARQSERARPALILFPRYEAGSRTQVSDQPRSVALTRMVNNSFNYLVSGEPGFAALCDIVRHAHCRQLVYSDLDEAVARIEQEITQPL